MFIVEAVSSNNHASPIFLVFQWAMVKSEGGISYVSSCRDFVTVDEFHGISEADTMFVSAGKSAELIAYSFDPGVFSRASKE